MWSKPDPADRALGERLAREGLAAIEAARAAGSGFDDELRREAAAAMIAFLQGKTEETARVCAEAAKRYAGREGSEEFVWLEGLVAAKQAEKRAKFDEALRIRPRFPLALYARGWSGGGYEDFDRAIQCAPGFAEPYIFRGSSRVLELKDPRGAADDFNVLIGRNVHLAPAYNGRALAKLRMGDLEGAIADATESIQVRPEGYHLPWIHRAEARLLKSDFEGAIADATKAVEYVDVDSRGKPLVIRGRAKLGKGDREGAVADFRAAGPEGDPYLKELGTR
jgi:tetratricopeptide (TPR) repeat protein